jgi:tetratricopeptide (TPR) repeat protein
MVQRESYSSRSSVPSLQAEDYDDETDEILIFEEDGNAPPSSFEVEEEYEYGVGFHEDLPQGYSLTELEQTVTFVRSSKNLKKGDFDRERKSLLWCIENGYEEVQPGVWSGCWYFTYLFGEDEGKRAWVETMNRRLVKEGGGRARQVSIDNYAAMLLQKDKGKRAFCRAQYKSALDCYVTAEELMGGDIIGMYLVPHQRTELVTLLSNQSECYIRMKKYDEAITQAAKALQLDKRHSKSLLRRAKATLRGAESHGSSAWNSMAAARAAEDLQAIIEMKGEVVPEAESLIEEIEEKLNVTTPISGQ